MSFSFLLLNKNLMFTFLPKGDFVHLAIQLHRPLSFLLMNLRKALPGQGPHVNIFTLKTVTATISPLREPKHPLFSDATHVNNFCTRRGSSSEVK